MGKSWKERVESTLLICRNEWPSLLWMVFLNFLLTAGQVLATIVITALLLVKVGIHALPGAFILSAAILVPYFAFYNYIERITSRKIVLIVSFIAYSLLILSFRKLLNIMPGDWYLLMTIYVFTTCITLLTSFQYWSFANFIFNPRQGKRLFPLLGMGGTVSAIVVGFSINPLTELFGHTDNLLYLLSGILFVSAVTVFALYRKLHLKKDPHDNENKLKFLESVTDDFGIIKKLPILKTLALVIFIMSLVYFILYFQFNRVIVEVFTTEEKLAGFYGSFNGFLNITILLYQLFLTGRVTSRIGVIQTLFIHPVMLLVPVIVTIVNNISFLPVTLGLFVFSLGEKTFSQTAIEAMYGAVPDKFREQAQSFMKIIITPAAIGVAGLSLQILVLYIPDYASILSVLLLPLLLGAWGFYIWGIKEQYIETLFGNFAEEEKKESLAIYQAFSKLSSRDTFTMLRRTLSQGSNSMKVFAMELAGEMKLEQLKEEIITFLTHEDIELRAAATGALGKLGGEDMYPQLIRIYQNQPRDIKKLILENLKLIDIRKYDLNLPLMLQEETDPIMQGIILEHIWSRNPALSSQVEIFEALVQSDQQEVRLQAARCIRYDREKQFVKNLKSLLSDPDREINRQALVSAKAVNVRDLIPLLVSFLESDDESLAHLAMEALIEMRRGVPDVIRQELTFMESLSVLTRKLLIIAAVGETEDIEFILSSMDKIPAEAGARALNRYIDTIQDFRRIPRCISKLAEILISQKKIEIREELLAAYCLEKHLTKDKKLHQMLMLLLQDRLHIQRQILLSALHILFPTEQINLVKQNIFSANPRSRSIALEALENIIPAEFRNEIIPLFEKDNLEDEIKYITELYRREEFELGEIVYLFHNCGDYWLKSWAFYAAGSMQMNNWRTPLETGLFLQDPLLVEHAQTGLKLLDTVIQSEDPAN